MRFVIVGAGAIGGVVGARLHQAGHDVTLVARGAHYEAIRDHGLTFQTPLETSVLKLPVTSSPEDLRWHGDELILLATKSQDTPGAADALAAAGCTALPIVCLQNGVANERYALRLFADVYAALVMLPSAHLEPGLVQAYGTALTGVIDVGRYPSGIDGRAQALAAALGGAHFSSHVRPDVMRFKYAKLLNNLGNAADGVCGEGAAALELTERARAEARAVLEAAGIDFVAPGVGDVQGFLRRIDMRPIGADARAGSSTSQSLLRRTGSVESDYLNGEIVLLGRLHGVHTPVNAFLQESIRELAQARRAPGSMTTDEVLERLSQRELELSAAGGRRG